MLWFDNDIELEFDKRLLRAAKYLNSKYNVIANICHVHPDMIVKDQVIAGITVKKDKCVQPNHFWIGFIKNDEFFDFSVKCA